MRQQQHIFYWFSFQHQEEKSSSEEVQKCVNYRKVTFNLDAPSWNRSWQSMHYGLLIHLDKMDHWRFVIFCTHAVVRLHCAVLEWPIGEKVIDLWRNHHHSPHGASYMMIIISSLSVSWLKDVAITTHCGFYKFESHILQNHICSCDSQSILFWRIAVLLQNWVALGSLGSLRNTRKAAFVSLPTSH